jgi:SAM-dependent methyltransferase
VNAHVPSLQRSLSDVVEEYEAKKVAIPSALASFQAAITDMKMAATIGGTHGQVDIDVRAPWDSSLQNHLLKSAWLHVYDGLNIRRISSPNDKRLFDQAMANPPEFTIDNIRATFGKYVKDPRGNILRGLAEVFCGLDQSYKSHDKVKIGVEGLPKRVVLSGFSGWSGYGRDRVSTILNALAAYQGRPLVEYDEVRKLEELGSLPQRGVRLKTFKNGNGHLFFDPPTLTDINKALAEFYGDVLADTTEEKPAQRQVSTAVSKDLQYYPTPTKVVTTLVDSLHKVEGQMWLEPSCGCGRFLKALKAKGARVYGVEYDAGRATMCKAQGFAVLHANFLETAPEPKYDGVMMNPPFYGRHYAKHVRHAYKFLKPGGLLKAILPVTARDDHGELDDIVPKPRWGSPWEDLPVGSFSESGTNINTVVLTIRAPELSSQTCASGSPIDVKGAPDHG